MAYLFTTTVDCPVGAFVVVVLFVTRAEDRTDEPVDGDVPGVTK
jgi:hypothetical protein